MTARKKPSATTALPEDLVRAWSETWVNRARPYALQQVDGSYRWIHDAVTGATLAAHLAGDLTLALSSADARGLAKWACLDIDQRVTPEVLLRLRDTIAERGLPGTVEASRRGGHLWLLFEAPVPAAIVRTAVLGLLGTVEVQDLEAAACEVYPEAWTHGALGHAVRHPLGVHRLTGKCYPLFDEDGLPCAYTSPEAALRALLTLPWIPRRLVEDLATQFALSAQAPSLEPDEVTPPATRSSTRSAMIRWIDTHISPLDLLAEYAPDAQMRRRGQGYLGWCPFHDDKAPDAHGQPGTPSFYVVYNTRHGWSWHCLSTNCPQHDGPMRHSFRLFQELNGLDVAGALVVAVLRWPEADA
jgi:hypothetical protein